MHRILFIINPKAGTKKKDGVENAIVRNIDRTQFSPEIAYTGKAGDGTIMARDAVEKGFYAAVAVGGDGTVSEVGCALAGSGTALGIIPCGSGDGLALHIGMSRNPVKAVSLLNTSRVVTADYCTLNGHPFFCTCGVGFDAFVSLQFTKSGKRGFATYVAETLRGWLTYSPVTYSIETDDGMKMTDEAVLITCANASQWGNQARIAPRASITDGMLDITIIKPFNALQAAPLAVHLMNGTIDESHLIRSVRCSSVRIERQYDGPVHFDGDPTMMGKELEIKVIPQGLKMLVPEGKDSI